jgi:uncharacterized protein YcgI (DUF1989 family)
MEKINLPILMPFSFSQPVVSVYPLLDQECPAVHDIVITACKGVSNDVDLG